MQSFTVTWDMNYVYNRQSKTYLSESGFADDEQAYRFIDKICKQIAPDKSYFVLTPGGVLLIHN